MLHSSAARILLAMLLGIAYAILSIQFDWNTFTLDWIAPLGDAFLRILKLLAVPLVLVSVITGIASLPNPKQLGSLGYKTLLAYLCTTILALCLGIGLMVGLQPGKTLPEDQLIKNRLEYEQFAQAAGIPTIDGQNWLSNPAYAELFAELESERSQALVVSELSYTDSVGFFHKQTGVIIDGFRLTDGSYRIYHKGQPINVAGELQPGDELRLTKAVDFLRFFHNGQLIHEVEMVAGLADKLDKKKAHQPKKGLGFLVDTLVPDNLFTALSDIKSLLQIIFFGLLLGMALLVLPKTQASPLLALIDSLNSALLLIINWVMHYAPIFVFALLAGTIVPLASSLQVLWDVLLSLLSFGMVTLLGLLLLAYGFYPLLRGLVTGNWNYRQFLVDIWPVQSMAFSTSSSAATLPVTLRVVVEKLGVPPAIANFVLPIASSINMDGTGLYMVCCVMFLSNWYSIELGTTDYLLMISLITLSSIGAAAIPSGGLILLMVVLESMGMNAAWIAIILPLDRILDMFRTVVNVTGDITVASIIHYLEK